MCDPLADRGRGGVAGDTTIAKLLTFFRRCGNSDLSPAANLIGEQARSPLDDNTKDAAAMFDYLPDTTQAPAQTDTPLLALRFLATSGARLTRAAQRIGGEDGAALAQAIRDMAVDSTVDPAHWPIDAMVAMLHRLSAR